MSTKLTENLTVLPVSQTKTFAYVALFSGETVICIHTDAAILTAANCSGSANILRWERRYYGTKIIIQKWKPS